MLKEQIEALPKTFGIYQFFNRDREPLYIGKAKDLKKRVKSYFYLTPEIRPKYSISTRIGKMLSQVENIEYIVIDSEEDALILEDSLIKQLRPKYNILLRDDKRYPYIYIDESLDFPRFEITRKVIRGDRVRYYGPFPKGSKALLDSLYELFPLVQKRGSLEGKKACLFYDIKRCLAPCEGKVSKDEYKKIIKEAKEAILDRSILINKLEEKMFSLSFEERFEEAIIYRDRIETIRRLQIDSVIDLARDENYDIFTIVEGKSQWVFLKIFVRNGKVISSDYRFFRTISDFKRDSSYKQLLLNYYKKVVSFEAKEALVAHTFQEMEEVEKAIYKLIGSRVKIKAPKRGKKVKLIELAIKNANELLKRKEGQKNGTIEIEIERLFSLTKTPLRIESFDNSHLMGESPVGGMVVWDSGIWDKESFRRYSLNSKDEYHQMQEVLERRIRALKKEPLPDLWVLDGGKSVLSLALKILKREGLNLDVIAIAKEKINFKSRRAKGGSNDTIYTQNGEVFRLKSSDKRLIFVQKLRDKAHKFALNYHTKKREKESLEIEILKVKGVSDAVLRRLLNYFGSFDSIQKASMEEITQITNKKIAKAIKGQKI